jgi:hypothetical protein
VPQTLNTCDQAVRIERRAQGAAISALDRCIGAEDLGFALLDICWSGYMTVKKRGLGRGLDSLLGAAHTPPSVEEVEQGMLRQLPIDLVKRGRYQPRSRIDEGGLQELAESIRAQGVLQPIVVRPLDDSRYEIVAGERRWRASQLAELDTIPAVVREVTDPTRGLESPGGSTSPAPPPDRVPDDPSGGCPSAWKIPHDRHQSIAAPRAQRRCQTHG